MKGNNALLSPERGGRAAVLGGGIQRYNSYRNLDLLRKEGEIFMLIGVLVTWEGEYL